MSLPQYGASMGDRDLITGAAQDTRLSAHDVSLASLLTTVSSHTSSIATLAPLTAIQYPIAFMTTPVLAPTAATTATVMVDNKTYFQYLGRTNAVKGACKVAFVLKTSLVANADPSSDWGEVAIWKGIPTDPSTTNGLPASLLRLGFTDCDTDLLFKASPGLLTVAVTWSSANCPIGSDLWVSFGSSAQTAAQFESTIINRFAFGITLRADGRSSTLGTGGLLASGLSINSTVGVPVVSVWLT